MLYLYEKFSELLQISVILKLLTVFDRRMHTLSTSLDGFKYKSVPKLKTILRFVTYYSVLRYIVVRGR